MAYGHQLTNPALDIGAAQRCKSQNQSEGQRHDVPMEKALRERAARVIPGGMYGHQAVGALPEGYPQFSHALKSPGCGRGWNPAARPDVRLSARSCSAMGMRRSIAPMSTRWRRVMRSTGPSPLMVDLAEKMVSTIRHADWAMFCKNGSDATTMALMTARAHTGRNGVVRARGAYHGSQPWANPRPRGIAPGDQAEQFLRLQ